MEAVRLKGARSDRRGTTMDRRLLKAFGEVSGLTLRDELAHTG
jgi:hypothetical protein